MGRSWLKIVESVLAWYRSQEKISYPLAESRFSGFWALFRWVSWRRFMYSGGEGYIFPWGRLISFETVATNLTPEMRKETTMIFIQYRRERKSWSASIFSLQLFCVWSVIWLEHRLSVEKRYGLSALLWLNAFTNLVNSVHLFIWPYFR